MMTMRSWYCLLGLLFCALSFGADLTIDNRVTGKKSVYQVKAPVSLVGSKIEQIDGTLLIAHADDFANGRSRYEYHVKDSSGGTTKINVADPLPILRSGSKVRVSGKRSGSTIDPSTITILSVPAKATAATQSVTPHVNKVLVVLANFNNTMAPAFTQAQAQAAMVNVANYYNEVSYGQQTLAVTVTPVWVNIGIPSVCALSMVAAAADPAAAALGATYNPANYNFTVYLMPSQQCGYLGTSYVGYPGAPDSYRKSLINGEGAFQNPLVVPHEMGHAFGLYHAGSLNCGTATIGGACSADEYGDPWDTMGNQRVGHFNAQQKATLGWIPPAAVQTYTSGSANYTLSAIESAGGSTYAVKIPTTNANRTYWLEFRQPIGFDSFLSSYPTNGVQVRVSYPFDTAAGSDDTEIIDMTPGSPAGIGDSALSVGQSYSDGGISFSVTGACPSGATVTVSRAGAGASSTALISSANPTTTGLGVTFTATVTGTNPTGMVSFIDGGTSLCTSALANRTAICTTSALSVGTHNVTASYSGDSGNAASTSSVLVETVTGGGTSTATASFISTDTTTQGNWKGKYGSEGYQVIYDNAAPPTYVAWLTMGGSAYNFLWSGTTTDVRSLQRSGTGRLAACWFNSAFTVDINMTDSISHQVALYLLDWDGGGARSERIDVLDAATQQVLATQTVSAYQGGVYLLWKLHGHVLMRFTSLAGPNAVVSGIFFDP